MAVYKNDARGRSVAMMHINRLIEEGYTRTDVKDVGVKLEKKVKEGLIAYVVDVVEFKHNALDKTIEVKQWENVFNAKKAIDMLYGFASPSVECRNAVRAGLFNEADVEILRDEYSEKDWIKK